MFAFTGWLISSLMIKLLFWPAKPINILGIKFSGLLPARQQEIAIKTGSLVQAEFHAYKGLDEKVADPALLKKLKPEIENHVDHFLKEKLKTVFPILAQFMGEKTMNQFKTAFLAEIDTLFPVLMKNYVNELKNEAKLDSIVSEKINALSITQVSDFFYKNFSKQIFYFKIACTCFGILMASITVLIIWLNL
jgi:uncharacterized membrane protein YheB (UPF0754 family)